MIAQRLTSSLMVSVRRLNARSVDGTQGAKSIQP
jgi:hypothetical protein